MPPGHGRVRGRRSDPRAGRPTEDVVADQPDPAAQDMDGGLAGVLVLVEFVARGQRDDGLTQGVFMSAVHGGGAAPVPEARPANSDCSRASAVNEVLFIWCLSSSASYSAGLGRSHRAVAPAWSGGLVGNSAQADDARRVLG